MGFSEIAVAAVLFSTFLLIGIVLSASYFNYLDTVFESKKIREDILYSKINTRVEIINATYYNLNNTLVIIFENVGDTVLKLRFVNIIVDGVLIGNVTDFEYTVNSRNDTSIALQGDRVVVRIPYLNVPSRVALITENGVKVIGSVQVI